MHQDDATYWIQETIPDSVVPQWASEAHKESLFIPEVSRWRILFHAANSEDILFVLRTQQPESCDKSAIFKKKSEQLFIVTGDNITINTQNDSALLQSLETTNHLREAFHLLLLAPKGDYKQCQALTWNSDPTLFHQEAQIIIAKHLGINATMLDLFNSTWLKSMADKTQTYVNQLRIPLRKRLFDDHPTITVSTTAEHELQLSVTHDYPILDIDDDSSIVVRYQALERMDNQARESLEFLYWNFDTNEFKPLVRTHHLLIFDGKKTTAKEASIRYHKKLEKSIQASKLVIHNLPGIIPKRVRFLEDSSPGMRKKTENPHPHPHQEERLTKTNHAATQSPRRTPSSKKLRYKPPTPKKDTNTASGLSLQDFNDSEEVTQTVHKGHLILMVFLLLASLVSASASAYLIYSAATMKYYLSTVMFTGLCGFTALIQWQRLRPSLMTKAASQTVEQPQAAIRNVSDDKPTPSQTEKAEENNKATASKTAIRGMLLMAALTLMGAAISSYLWYASMAMRFRLTALVATVFSALATLIQWQRLQPLPVQTITVVPSESLAEQADQTEVLVDSLPYSSSTDSLDTISLNGSEEITFA